ncbi:hypothetical protein OG594_43895 [Streptomyces sp. NBC_01214]|uniref:hypothetical protein n=1 Tax=Streptomyces sp. NBC_01214 TaxID=2903777 RepID=UPI002252BCA1|nr:hypothetical protein [Streptomyces sp. NBC_01214]MCX4808453.1 hypothetical protein [Streptomyces sp. NBC_01214]
MSHFCDHGESYRPELPPYSLPLARPAEKSSIPPSPQPAKGCESKQQDLHDQQRELHLLTLFNIQRHFGGRRIMTQLTNFGFPGLAMHLATSDVADAGEACGARMSARAERWGDTGAQ